MKKIIKKSITVITMLVIILTLALPTTAQAAGKIKLNKTKATLTITQKKKNPTYKLKVKGTKKKVKWKSSNSKVATVSKSGKVTAKKKGTTTITAKVSKKTLRCKITVKDTRKKSKTTNSGSSYTIKFNANKGKIVYGKSSVKVKKNKKIGGMPIPVRRGYIFKGWYNGSKKIKTTSTFSANTTLTAKWKKTTNDDLKQYMDIHYIRTVLHDELVSVTTDSEGSTLDYESDSTVKNYMCSTGINKGWRMSKFFDPDYFTRKMLSSYGVTFKNYKDAWECALGFENARNITEYFKVCYGTCEHNGGTGSDTKTCTENEPVTAVTKDVQVASFILCACGELFDDSNNYDMHGLLMELQGDTGHSCTEEGIYRKQVITPACIKHNHITYCMNTGDVLSTNVTTSPWTGGLSGMPEDPCRHEYLIINKGFDDEFQICKKCGERK